MRSPAPPHSRARACVGRAVIATALALAAVTLATRANADERQACVTASEKAQQLRSAGKLVDAREQLNVCGRPECPKLVQQDCTQWMSELLASLPSVVPGAKDRKGRDLVQVRLTVDGTVATEVLDGKALVLDPGVHTFVFESKGVPALEEQVVVKPGEKNRIVTVTFGTVDDAAPASGASTGAPADKPRGSSAPLAAYAFGGLGLVALGAAVVLDLTASSDAHDLRASCAPNCNQSDVDDIRTKYTIAGVTAGVGTALLATGIILLFTNGRGSSRAAAHPLRPFVTTHTAPLLRF